jgi:hypothetical protein
MLTIKNLSWVISSGHKPKNMKRTLSLALLGVFALSLSFIGCKKYQEGPGISLSSKKGRIAAVWSVSESYSDGVLDTCSSDCAASRAASTMEYAKDGKYTATTVWVSSGVALPAVISTGKWELSTDKMSIMINPDADSPDEGYYWSDYILKLKGKEMWTGTPTEKGTDPKYYTVYIAE